MTTRTRHRLTQWSLLTFYRSVHATCQRQIQKERQDTEDQLDLVASSEHKQAPALTEIATNPTLIKLHTDTHHSMFQQNWRRCRQKIHSGKHWQNPTLHQTRRQIDAHLKTEEKRAVFNRDKEGRGARMWCRLLQRPADDVECLAFPWANALS